MSLYYYYILYCHLEGLGVKADLLLIKDNIGYQQQSVVGWCCVTHNLDRLNSPLAEITQITLSSAIS